MTEIITKEEIRLDELVFKHYKTLDFFDRVLEFNSHLNGKFYLSVGSSVYLPDVKNLKKERKVKTLW